MSLVNADYDLYQSLGLTNQPVDKGQGKSQSELQMEDFLNLMVTEMTHQDPFKPMDNAELATQISQFAAVSGIEQLNGSFNDLSGSLVSNQALQASGLVGRSVLVPTYNGYLGEGGSVKGVLGLSSQASNVTVRISNAAGSLVREISMGNKPAGEVNFTWDGLNDLGEPMPAGEYQISAQAEIDGEVLSPYVLVEAAVNSVSLGTDGLTLNLEGLGHVSFNDVAEIR
ncbi:MAG: flagellar hook capping protein [Sedimenticola sp.]|jgi:flagellar basal-body rod modification protein FlgD|nr:MAG: flagellar hook capping protein [Sedimenticola sp.]